MSSLQQIVDFLSTIGGYNCTVTVGERTDAIFMSFCARLVSVNYEYDTDILQLHLRQHVKALNIHSEVLSYVLLQHANCEIVQTTYDQHLIIKSNGKSLPIRINPMANSDREAFKNNLYEVKKPKRVVEEDSDDSPQPSSESGELACPYCSKKCSSTSGLTLHKKQCKKKPVD